jgi:hypothetical protein
MEKIFTLKTFLRLLAAAIVLAAVIVLIEERMENSAPAQSPAEVEVTRIVEQTVVITQIVERIITTTPQAQASIIENTPYVETATVIPTLEALTVLPEGVSAWCQPKYSYETNLIPTAGSLPHDAVLAEYVNGTLTVTTQMKSCTFMVVFNQPLPSGAHLKTQDLSQQVFIDDKLIPVAGDSHIGYLYIDHYFIIDPPYWEVTYTVSVYGPSDEKLWENPVIFRREWIPEPCPNGMLPDALTFKCN